ncbi:MAG: DUF2059 domain-containing protein [Paludibacterium sp.]|uniref:DUF2059 domain-containing protein n=1 Tax=Paludibacterium sp. TaxID=1917523 RepID=UPI0025F77C45|nr:DUF2059 domain-containing protein [Paludibacterium sp.]MBV8047329.1 DUF2059 domain-containing protein [Paludibacterium sp.]MBV8648055.1 DUF2059 domain-containing protein [Paludibacterium sp.]
MKKRLAVLCLLCVLTTPALAEAPSESEVHQLLTAMQVERNLDQMRVPMIAMVQKQMNDAFKGRAVTPAQQAVLGKLAKDLSALVMDEVSWSNMEPLVTQIYRETYTSEEIDGMLQFFQSPAGQAMTAKQPAVMRKMLVGMQPLLADMRPKVDALMQNAIKQLAQTGQTQPAN